MLSLCESDLPLKLVKVSRTVIVAVTIGEAVFSAGFDFPSMTVGAMLMGCK